MPDLFSPRYPQVMLGDDALQRMFWCLLTGELLFVAGLLGATMVRLSQQGDQDGAGSMALFFSCMVPLLALVSLALLFHFAHAEWVRRLALAAAILPALLLASVWLRSLYHAHAAAQMRSGRNAFPDEGRKRLAGAVESANLAEVGRLLTQTPQMQSPGRAGFTVLQCALDRLGQAGPREEIAIAVIRSGAQLNRPLASGGYPIRRAILHPSVVRALLESGADPNLRDAQGTPSWFAALELEHDRLLESLGVLLESGLDLTVTDGAGYDPVAYACSRLNWQAMQLLVEHGATWNRSRLDGRPVADIVCEWAGRNPDHPALRVLHARMGQAR